MLLVERSKPQLKEMKKLLNLNYGITEDCFLLCLENLWQLCRQWWFIDYFLDFIELQKKKKKNKELKCLNLFF